VNDGSITPQLLARNVDLELGEAEVQSYPTHI
jgi:hypothetical protein